jgi:cytochrome c peroxidase
MNLVVFLLLGGDLQSLGRQLFFDKRLSADNTVSCAHCHRPDKGFADSSPVSRGVHGAEGKFNSPTLLNRGSAKRFFWDGRAESLEEQAEGPLLNPIEMGNSRDGLVRRVAGIPEYAPRFERSFGDPAVTLPRIVKAIAAYEKTLKSELSLYDEWRRGRRQHWTSRHEQGRQLFFGKAGCAGCHRGPHFTDDQLHPDAQGGRWKTPPLRELLLTAPYLHDGRAATLDEALRIHAPRVGGDERVAILRFLESLTCDNSR